MITVMYEGHPINKWHYSVNFQNTKSPRYTFRREFIPEFQL